MTTIVLVRHGHVEGIAPERFRGRRDLLLTPLGQQQAEATAQYIAATWKPVAIYSSPLQRCLSTADAIAAAVGGSVELEAGLTDLDYGEWHGLTSEEARERWPSEAQRWEVSPESALIPGGEMLLEAQARVVRAVEVLIQHHVDEVVVVVGHESVNRLLLMHVLQLPLAFYRRLGQEPCAVNLIEVTEGDSIVRRLNDVHHLSGIS